MKNFFKKPIKTISVTSFAISIFLIFTNLLIFASIVVYNYYNNGVIYVEKQLNNSKIQNMIKNYEKYKNDFSYNNVLYNELSNVSTLSKYYKVKGKVTLWLIDYYLEKNNIKKALNISEKYIKKYPNDFKGRFQYLKILEKANDKHLNKQYSALYAKYHDIKEVRNKYIEYLQKTNQINLALSILNTNKINNKSFHYFYKQYKESFSSKNSRYLTVVDKNMDNIYNVNFMQKVINFGGIRVDLNLLHKNSVISLKDASVIYDNIEYKLNNYSINHLRKIHNNYFIVNGTNPYFNFELPKELKNNNGELFFNFKIYIDEEISLIDNINSTFQINGNIKVPQMSSMQIFYQDNMTTFSSKQSKYIKGRYLKKNQWQYEFSYNFKKFNGIRFDFNKLNSNIVLSNLKLIMKYKGKEYKLNNAKLNDLKYINGKMTIIGSDPYVVPQVLAVNKGISGNIKFIIKVDLKLKINQEPQKEIPLCYTLKNNKLVAIANIKTIGTDKIKLNLPNINGLYFSAINVVINNKDIYRITPTKKNSINIKRSNNIYTISSHAYIILILQQAINCQKIKFEIVLENRYES